MKQETVLKAYRLLWSDLEKIYTAGGVLARADFQIDEAESSTRKIVIKTVCYFPECNYKPQSSKKVDVLLQSSETYASAENEIAKSNVRLLYLRRQQNDAVPLLPIHYDFDPTVGGAHPIFHAQLDTYKFTVEELKKVKFRANIQSVSHEWYSNVRIPTACMNFCSALLGLTADHFRPSAFSKALGIIRRSELIAWHAQCSTLQKSVASGGYLPSHHWYS